MNYFSHILPIGTKKAEIILINPDFSKTELGTYAPPDNHLGLNRLATYLDNKNISVAILNTTGIKGENTPETLSKFLNNNHNNFSVFGFYLTSWNITYILNILKTSNFLDKKIVFGGPLASAAPQPLMDSLINIGLKKIGVVQGYGEFILEKLILYNLKDVKEAWVYDEGYTHKGTIQKFSQTELNSLPLLNPKFNISQIYLMKCIDNMDLGDNSISDLYGYMGLDTNHGCAFKCSFCSIPFLGRYVVSRDPKKVVDEIEYTSKTTGIFRYTFTYTNVMFYTSDWIREFCNEMIKRGLNEYINWNGYHHINVLELLDPKDFILMKQSGTDEIVIGVQSIEENICEIFNRPKNTYEKVKTLVEITKKTGLRLVIDYITSVPGENTDKIIEFYEYCMKNDIECRNYDLKIYPATEISRKPLDLINYDLVPITGDISPELGAYLLVKKDQDHKLNTYQLKLREFNNRLKPTLKVGKYIINNINNINELIDTKIPNNNLIPLKVKKSMILLLKSYLNPNLKTQTTEYKMKDMFKKLSNITEDSPPILKKLKTQLIQKMGEQKFNELINKYKNS